jgi:hypothetical protein
MATESYRIAANSGQDSGAMRQLEITEILRQNTKSRVIETLFDKIGLIYNIQSEKIMA